MKIDGKEIAQTIFQTLKEKTQILKKKGLTPHLAIILVGDNPASVSYVNRKKMKAEEIGAKAIILKFASGMTNKELLGTIEQLNSDPTIHGIIIQRPLPQHIEATAIDQAVLPAKDIDAFHSKTPFEMPLAKAVFLLLEYVHNNCHPGLDPGSSQLDSGSETGMTKSDNKTFIKWLQEKNTVVIGKGKTGGGPIIAMFQKHNITPTIIDRQTKNPAELIKQADILISAVGKQDVITADMVKKGVILISVGQHKQSDEKFHGDYENEVGKQMASWHSPTPGGVGPVNVACLLTNLLQACENNS